MIAADTMKILADKKYLNDQEAEVDLSASLEFAINNTVLYDGGTCGKFQTRHDTKIEVTSETTIEALTRISSEEKKAKTAVRRTKNESEQNKKPTVEQGKEDEGEQRGVESRFSIKHSSDGKALGTEELENGSDNDDDSVDIFVLNFASGRNPGGGFLRGAQAQEESIAKVSGLYPCLETQHESFYMPNRRSHSPFYTDNVSRNNLMLYRRETTECLCLSNDHLCRFEVSSLISAVFCPFTGNLCLIFCVRPGHLLSEGARVSKGQWRPTGYSYTGLDSFLRSCKCWCS